jgi:hypothetical protein
MAAQQTSSKGFPSVLELTVTRPGLAISLGALSFFAGFVGTGWVNRADLILAQGGGNRAEDERPGQSLQADPDVWPVLHHSFPQQLDLLSPEPLIIPGRSLGPARANNVTLAAAFRSEADAPVRTGDTEGANRHLETAALDQPHPNKPTTSTENSESQAPTACLPDSLRAVLTDLEARFGDVTVVSTTHLHTDNHSPGSVRERMHLACKAIDFRTTTERSEVIAYLRSRPEVGGVNSYRNGVIHFDLKDHQEPIIRTHKPTLQRPTAATPKSSKQLLTKPVARTAAGRGKMLSQSPRNPNGDGENLANKVPELPRMFD